MALKYEVNKYKAKDVLELKDSKGEIHKIPILLTYEDADELMAINEDPKKELKFDRFAEILFHDEVEKVKEITGKGYEDCVVMVGFQFMSKLFKNRMEFINSTVSMRQTLKKT